VTFLKLFIVPLWYAAIFFFSLTAWFLHHARCSSGIQESPAPLCYHCHAMQDDAVVFINKSAEHALCPMKDGYVRAYVCGGKAQY
jgi:hypothetical protein